MKILWRRKSDNEKKLPVFFLSSTNVKSEAEAHIHLKKAGSASHSGTSTKNENSEINKKIFGWNSSKTMNQI